MRRVWLNFGLWSTVGWVFLTSLTPAGRRPLIAAYHADPGFFLGYCFGLFLIGLLLGSVIYGFWYRIAGRKKKSEGLSADSPKQHTVSMWLTVIAIVVMVLIIGSIVCNTDSDQEVMETSAPSVVSVRDVVYEELFSINFPSEPRRYTIQEVIDDNVLDIVNYQIDDGNGLYLVSLGTLRPSLRGEKMKKTFVRDIFEGLISTAPGASIRTLTQADEFPYKLDYSYTSKMIGLDWVHMGQIFLINESQYMKITLVYPVDLMETAKSKYMAFSASLRIKKGIGGQHGK